VVVQEDKDMDRQEEVVETVEVVETMVHQITEPGIKS